MNADRVLSFSPNSTRVRDRLLIILSQEFPLSVKELYNRIRKDGQEVTYQAVHKVVQDLMEEKIVEKEGRGVKLSKNWIHQVKDYAMAIDMMYTRGHNQQIPSKIDKPVKIVIEDLSKYVTWMAENFRDGKFTGGKPSSVHAMFYHAVWPLRFNFMDFELLRQMTTNCKTMGFSVCDMPLDKWICQHYKLGGVIDFKTGVKADITDDYFANGDMVIRAEFSPETRKYMNNIYSKIGDLKQLFNFYFLDEKKNETTHIEITIERNPTMARMIENQVESVLKNKEKRK